MPHQSLQRAILFQPCIQGTTFRRKRTNWVLAEGECEPSLNSWEAESGAEMGRVMTQVLTCSLRAGGQSANICGCSTSSAGRGLPNHPRKEKPHSSDLLLKVRFCGYLCPELVIAAISLFFSFQEPSGSPPFCEPMKRKIMKQTNKWKNTPLCYRVT